MNNQQLIITILLTSAIQWLIIYTAVKAAIKATDITGRQNCQSALLEKLAITLKAQ